MSHCSRRLQRIGLLLTIAGMAGLILSCGVGGLTVGQPPNWACPSPTPRPFGTSGPIKQQIPLPTATPSGPQEYENVYYEEWEQEYPGQRPPFPSPTPYALVGLNYTLGQRVAVFPLHVMVSAHSDGLTDKQQQLYWVDITWYNHTVTPLPISYGERVRVRSVTRSDGTIVTDSIWGYSRDAMVAANLTTDLPEEIPPGESRISVPILAPIGEVKTVEITFRGQIGYTPPIMTATTLPGTPTSTPAPSSTPTPLASPTPNTDLAASAANEIAVTWSKTTVKVGPPCGDAGALTSWDNAPGVAWGSEAALAIPAPPGADRLMEIALAQVGKPYVWGAKGPEQFDCSGLTEWSYAQIGIRIPMGTAGQWPNMTAAAAGQIKQGDLVFFDIALDGQIDHVGLLADLNGDGKWDLVHAANPQLGVRADYDIFNSAYYRPRIAGFRTAR
jgi:cell wall-associated NlpC family hydrolase